MGEDVEVGVRRPRLVAERRVGLGRDDVVAPRRQLGRDAAHAGADVDDAGAAGDQGVGQPGLAGDVGSLRDEVGEVAP